MCLCVQRDVHTPGLPLLLALALLPRTVGLLLELVGEQHAVVSRVFEQRAQPVVLPALDTHTGTAGAAAADDVGERSEHQVD